METADRIPSLDGLRAVAIAAVVWHHCGAEAQPVFGRGLGVTLFFTISGLLITELLLRERDRSGSIDVQRFYLGRALRIFPLYYGVLGLYLVLVGLLEARTAAGREFFRNLPAYLTFTSNWLVDHRAGHRVIFYFAWSLAAQEQFYTVWPWLLRRRWPAWAPAGVAGAAVVVGEGARLALARGWLPASTPGLFLAVGLATPIFLGCLLALLLRAPGGRALAQRVAGRPWSLPVAIAALAAVVLFEATPTLGVSLAMAYLVLASVVRPDHLLSSLLEHPAVRHVGKVSFGVYLLHLLCINAARRSLPGLSQAQTYLLAMPLAVVAASLTWWLVERPVRRLARRWEARRSAAAGALGAESVLAARPRGA